MPHLKRLLSASYERVARCRFVGGREVPGWLIPEELDIVKEIDCHGLGIADLTGIGAIDNSQLTIDSWYSLDGRKFAGEPKKKGVYIHNGRKVKTLP